MLLTSIRRVRTHVMGQQSDPLTADLKNDRLLKQWMVTVSRSIERYLDRDLEIGNKTEYYTLSSRRKQFWIKAPPIVMPSTHVWDGDVYVDLEGLFTGRESIIPNCFPDEYLSSIRFPYAYWMEWTGVKSIRIRYNGGLAAHAVNSVYTLSASQTGAWAAGSYVSGSLSGAVGVVVSYAAGTLALTVENYYGAFVAGDVLTQTTVEATGTTTATGTIATISSQCLAEVAPEIVSACEMQIRYMWKHTTDFENIGSVKDGTTTRDPLSINHEWPLLDEVRDLLGPYRSVKIL